MPTLHWINKDKTIKNIKNIPYRILRENKDLSYSLNITAKHGETEISPLIEGRCPQDRGVLECRIKNEELRVDKIDNLSTPPVNSVDILPAKQGGIGGDMGQLSAKQGGITSSFCDTDVKQGGIESYPSLSGKQGGWDASLLAITSLSFHRSLPKRSGGNVNEVDKGELDNILESKSTPYSLWDTYYKEMRNCNLILWCRISESRTNGYLKRILTRYNLS